MEGVHNAEAVIDNGEFGAHTIRFETGRLARQAAGSALVTLDGETVVLSAGTDQAGHHGGPGSSAPGRACGRWTPGRWRVTLRSGISPV